MFPAAVRLNHFIPQEYNSEALMNPANDLQDKGASQQKSWLRRRHVQDRLLHLIGSHRYQYLDIPILAPTELFLRKSGGEMASQMP